jgi:3-phosphoshikimate 1-carboxyvinyltransferase
LARLAIEPGGPLRGRFRPPGDKSITHRAYLLALLARGVSEVRGPNPGADCAGTLECARRLGARVTLEGTTVRIEGTAGALVEPDGVLDCGNSGTTLRLLAGVLAPHPLLAVLTGHASLRARPVDRVIAPLVRMGAALQARAGDRLPPLVVRGGGLRPARIELEVASAQVASCVLFAGLGAEGESTVTLPGEARDHTERMFPAFGVPVRVERRGAGRSVSVTGRAVPRASSLTVAGDPSAAAFLLAAAAAVPGAEVTAEGVSLNPTRCGLLDALESMGAVVERRAAGEQGGEPVGDVTVRGPEALRPLDVPADWVPRMIDEVPAWVVAASAARGTSTLAGARELRVKETDRIAALVSNLRRLGIVAEERPDGLAIVGGAVAGGAVEAGGDHRIAMAFAVLGTRAAGTIEIDDAANVATSFPGFATVLAALGGRVRAA